MKERLPGKYILFLLLISFCFKTFGSVIGYYISAEGEEGTCLAIFPTEKWGLGVLLRFSLGTSLGFFTNNVSLDIMKFYSSVL